MSQLAEINDKFIDDYIFNHRNNLGKPTMGGTDWRFADIVAPAFREVLEIAKPTSILEIGFNAGGSALMFLSINRTVDYHSVDLVRNPESQTYLEKEFSRFWFYKSDSRTIEPKQSFLFSKYDMVFIDGDHTKEGVLSDIETALRFKPEYILLDDYRHLSHAYIEMIVTERYVDELEVVKVFEFNQCWKGYSMALCKVKNQ